jgi:hypothetical protein
MPKGRGFRMVLWLWFVSVPLKAGEPCRQVFHGDNTELRRAIAAMDIGSGRAALCQDIWTYEKLAISVRVRRDRGPVSAGERSHWFHSVIGAFGLSSSPEWKAVVMKSTFATITREPDGQKCLVNTAADGRVLKEFPHQLEQTAVEIPCNAIWERLQLSEVPASDRKEISDLLIIEAHGSGDGNGSGPRRGKRETAQGG